MQETEARPIRILGISGSPRNMATDLRAGAALIIAGLYARGETRITRIDHIFSCFKG